MKLFALISFIAMCVCFIILVKKEIEIRKLQEEKRKLKWDIADLKNDIAIYEYNMHRYQDLFQQEQRKNKNAKQIPKGTTQAVKDAMVRSHPDNGGKQEDFIMYRRAYNILTGKEKL